MERMHSTLAQYRNIVDTLGFEEPDRRRCQLKIVVVKRKPETAISYRSQDTSHQGKIPLPSLGSQDPSVFQFPLCLCGGKANSPFLCPLVFSLESARMNFGVFPSSLITLEFTSKERSFKASCAAWSSFQHWSVGDTSKPEKRVFGSNIHTSRLLKLFSLYRSGNKAVQTSSKMTKSLWDIDGLNPPQDLVTVDLDGHSDSRNLFIGHAKMLPRLPGVDSHDEGTAERRLWTGNGSFSAVRMRWSGHSMRDVCGFRVFFGAHLFSPAGLLRNELLLMTTPRSDIAVPRRMNHETIDAWGPSEDREEPPTQLMTFNFNCFCGTGSNGAHRHEAACIGRNAVVAIMRAERFGDGLPISSMSSSETRMKSFYSSHCETSTGVEFEYAPPESPNRQRETVVTFGHFPLETSHYVPSVSFITYNLATIDLLVDDRTGRPTFNRTVISASIQGHQSPLLTKYLRGVNSLVTVLSGTSTSLVVPVWDRCQ
ncbi:hypothetical protein B0H14DRAFT_2654958 [Mycena olivaceomarginata]|nr:hypothetical protein B0H14DRAFT_2654958 [Mycena olivaceomarginata]